MIRFTISRTSPPFHGYRAPALCQVCARLRRAKAEEGSSQLTHRAVWGRITLECAKCLRRNRGQPCSRRHPHAVGQPGSLSELQRQRSCLWCPVSPLKHTEQNKTLHDVLSEDTLEAKTGRGARRPGRERQERVSGAGTLRPAQRCVADRQAR